MTAPNLTALLSLFIKFLLETTATNLGMTNEVIRTELEIGQSLGEFISRKRRRCRAKLRQIPK